MADAPVRVDYDDFKAFSKALRNADRDLSNAFKRELRKALLDTRTKYRAAWQPVESKLATSWGMTKPIKGGKANIKTSVSNTRARVSSKSRSQRDLNAGFVKHPGVSNPYDAEWARKHWYATPVSGVAGWWDDTTPEVVDATVRDAAQVVERFAAELAARIDATTPGGTA